MISRMRISRRNYIILASIIFLQATVCMFYGALKKGYFVDELWGAGLANSYFRPRLFTPNVFNTNTYLTGDFFYNYLTVSPEDGFSIASVWYNQSQDSHPPLYFLLYHALSCLEMGTFSKWTGFAINLFFHICTNVCIFLTTRKITGYAWMGIASVALWGFSTEVVSYTLCARMYMMTAFFVVLFVYRSLIFYEPLRENSWKEHFYLLLATTGGCLSHYYFYIVAFIMAALTCFYLWIEMGVRKAYRYGLSVLGGVFLSWAIYPRIFESLAYGDGRGREAIKNMKDIGSLWNRIWLLVEQIEEKLLYKPVFIIVLLASSLIVVTIVLRVLWKKQFDVNLKTQVSMLLVTELTFVFYMLAVAKLQPFYTNRYYFPITTLLWAVVIGNVVIFAHIFSIRSKGTIIAEKAVVLSIAFILIAAIGGIIKSHVDHKVMFLFPRQEGIIKQIQQLNKPSAVFIVKEHGAEYTLTAHCLELSNCSEILCVDISTTDDLMEYDIHDENESTVIFAAAEFDQQQLLDQLLDQTSYDSFELIGRGSGVWWEDVQENFIYRLSK